MTKWFNTAGPCKPNIHYTLPTSQRLPELKRLIDQQNYFVIHAPRQTGKTTAMLTLAQELTASGKYTAVLLSLEVGAVFPHAPGTAERAILDEWKQSVKFRLPTNLQPTTWTEVGTGSQIGTFLSTWATDSPLPLVVFLDEIDALSDETLISVLRQLRSGYPRRPLGFPQCVALIGMRDVRDYKVASGGSDRLNTSSPFNIKVRSLTLSNFTLEDVSNLYEQH
ncbi:ATP-binding protein, partial [Anabaenopsis arnoldii]|nr:ATP-binding protein [Anabaenopsis arnoldii]MDH6090716.1 ATP-binding protein [Anabaenopsis arnoldii]